MADTSRRDELPQTANKERTSMRLEIICLQATIDAYQRLVNSLPEETRTQHFSTPTFRAYVADRKTTLADQARAAELLEQEQESNAFLRQQNQELEKNVEEYEEQLMMARHSVQLLTDTLTEQDRRLADIEASRLADPPADDNMAKELSRLRYDLSNEKATNMRFATNLRREHDDHSATAAALEEEKTVSTRLATDLRNLQDNHCTSEEELVELQNRYAKLQENYLQLKDDAQELHRKLQTARDALEHAVKQEPRAEPQESTHTERMLREELAHKDLVVRTLNRRLQNAEFQTQDKLAAAKTGSATSASNTRRLNGRTKN
jgi:predicted alpha/beta hydrolase family esterase